MLEIKSLYVDYGPRQVLKDINLTVKSGEVFCVIGPNGSGKSTLIRTVSGILSARSGSVQVNGQELARMSERQRAMLLAVVSQGYQFPPDYTVAEVVMMGRTPHMNWLGQPGKRDYAMVEHAMQSAQVEGMAGRRVGELSGGEQQRVALARALAQDTPLLLLDEPTSHLDLRFQSGLLNLVKELAFSHKLAVLMVLHDLNLSGLFADQIALLVDGQIQQLGRPEGVLTAQHLSLAYSIPVSVIPHPTYGTPLVLPDGRYSVAAD